MAKLFKDLKEGNPVFMVKYTSNIPMKYDMKTVKDMMILL